MHGTEYCPQDTPSAMRGAVRGAVSGANSGAKEHTGSNPKDATVIQNSAFDRQCSCGYLDGCE